jgi:chromosome segregation ATPase
MVDFPLELFFGLAILGIILALNFPKGRVNLTLKIPNFRKKEKEVEEIDKKLEEVVSSGAKEKVVKLDDAAQEAAKKFEVKEDLLSEMQTGGGEKKGEIPEKTPEISLPALSMESGELEKKVELEGDAVKDEKSEKIEFEDSDKLLEDLAKEVEKREEEQVDLLRDLKGQKFEVNELEKELSEVLERLKRLKA